MKLKTLSVLSVAGLISAASWAADPFFDYSASVGLTNPIVLLTSLTQTNSNMIINLVIDQDGAGKVSGYAQVAPTTTSVVNVFETVTNAARVLVNSNYAVTVYTNSVVETTNDVGVTTTPTQVEAYDTNYSVELPTNISVFSTNYQLDTSYSATNELDRFLVGVSTNDVFYTSNLVVVTEYNTTYRTNELITWLSGTETNTVETAKLFGPVTGNVTGSAGKAKVNLSGKTLGRGTTNQAATFNFTIKGDAAGNDLNPTLSGTLTVKGQPNVKVNQVIDLSDTLNVCNIDVDALTTSRTDKDNGTGNLKFTGKNTVYLDPPVVNPTLLGMADYVLTGTGSSKYNDPKETENMTANFNGAGPSKGTTLKWNSSHNGQAPAGTPEDKVVVNGKISGQTVKEDVTQDWLESIGD